MRAGGRGGALNGAKKPIRAAATALAAALVFSLAAIALGGCAAGGEKKSATFTAMDTVVSLSAWGDGADAALDEAKRLIASLEAELSATDGASAVSRANAGETVALGEDAARLVRRSLEMCEATGGALDVTVYPLVRAWGFTTGDHRVPPKSEIDALLPLVGSEHVRLTDDGTLSLDGGAMIDLGAVAKGYAADLVCETLRASGVEAALVNLGGNVQTLGKKPDGERWKIAVASPEGEGNACVVSTGGGAIVTSGSYQRYFVRDGRRYCHIIDPASGYPVENGLLSVTVIGESGFECDALSTAMFVLGEEGAISFWREHGGFEMILITDRGVSATSGIAPDVELAGGYAGGELTVVG